MEEIDHGAGKNHEDDEGREKPPRGDTDQEGYLDRHPALAGKLKRLFRGIRHDRSRTDEPDDEPETEVEELESSRVIGDFRIIREIGAGGMARVFEAEQVSLKRRVALKVLSPYLSMSVNAVKKFTREAEAGGRQRHPGIVSIYAVGEHEGIHFIAQELVEGGRTLADDLEQHRRRSDLPLGYFRDAAGLIAEVADALQHAHASGVIHRDVKPSNILLTREDRPKVTDFGLARMEDALALSRTGDFAGTPFYMSPEQAMSRRMGIDKRTDIFSLGVTLYEALTLERPFDGKTSQEVLRKIILQEPKDVRKVNPRAPRDLSVICLKAMEKNPNHRYQNMEEFAGDLRRFLQGEVIQARPAGVATKILKRVKRYPLLSSAIGLAAAALFLVIVVMPWIIMQNAKEEARKTKAINAFLETMLLASNPYKAGDMDMKVVDVLESAAKEIGSAFPEDPGIEASLRRTIGIAYYGLGRYGEAKALLEPALAFHLGVLGEDHPETLSTMNCLGSLSWKMGQYSDAEELHSRALEVRRRTLGEDHPDTLESMNNLALVYQDQDRLSEAEPLFREVLGRRTLALGEENDGTLRAMNNLALLYQDQDRLSEAEELFGRALEGRRSVLGDDHPNTLTTMNNLALVYEDKEKLPEAESMHRKALELRKRRLKDEHPQTLSSMLNLARVLKKQGKLIEAEALNRSALESYKVTLGEDHPETLTVMNNLACLLEEKRGGLKEAESLHRTVLEGRKRCLGEEHRSTLVTQNSLARVLASLGKITESESLLRRVVEVRSRKLGEESPRTISAMHNLAHVLQGQGKLPEAAELFKKILELSLKTLPKEHADIAYHRADYVNCLVRMKRYGEAEPQLLEDYARLNEGLGMRHRLTRESIERLIRLYDDWGKPEKAAEYAALLDASKEPSSEK